MIITTKTKNMVLLALVSTFILSIVSYNPPQQIFAQNLFQSQQSERNQSSVSPPPVVTTEENDKEPDAVKPTATKNDQKIILGNITIPIESQTQLSLEMPDSKITVQPNK
jgi:hypothetical protein